MDYTREPTGRKEYFVLPTKGMDAPSVDAVINHLAGEEFNLVGVTQELVYLSRPIYNVCFVPSRPVQVVLYEE
jgi:hypothetical protein